MKQLSTSKKILTLVAILFVPGFLFITINKTGDNEYLSLPIFGGSYIPSMDEPDGQENVLKHHAHSIDSISFFNLENEVYPVFANDTNVYLLHFFYAQDQNFSRDNLRHAKDIAEKAQRNKKIKVLSISPDPADTPEVLKQSLQKNKVHEHTNWEVLSQPSKDIFDFARNELFLDVFQNPIDSTQFFIDNVFLLVDSKHRIRGIYKPDLPKEMERLIDEVKVLIIEEYRLVQNR